MRIYLRIPIYKRRHAMAAGCKYDPDQKQWYIEEPVRPGLLIEDFTQWMEYPLEDLRANDQRATKKANGGSSPRS